MNIVIPVFNSCDLTWRCLMHIELAFGEHNVVIVDDGSTDGTPSMIEHMLSGQVFRTQIEYVRHHKNRGCHAAWNSGWRTFANHPWFNPRTSVVFLNNDVCVMPHALTWMEDALINGRRYVAGHVVNGKFDPSAMLALDAAPSDLVESEDAYNGSFFAVTADLLSGLDGFDEQFYLTYGDTDFIERMRKMGVKTCVEAAAVGYHGGSVTRRREFGRDRDVELDLADRDRFDAKWGHDEGVMGRHPRLPRAVMERARDSYWADGEPA